MAPAARVASRTSPPVHHANNVDGAPLVNAALKPASNVSCQI
jgi:hypothetical protein